MSKIFKINRIAIVTTTLIVTPVLLAAQSASSEPLLTPLWGVEAPFSKAQSAQHLRAVTQRAASPAWATAKMAPLTETLQGQHALAAFARTQNVYGDLVGGNNVASIVPLMEHADGGQAAFSMAVKAASVGVETALAHAWDTGQSPDAIRFIGKAEMEGYLTGDYAEKVLGATEKAFGHGYRIELLPVAYDDRLILKAYPTDAETEAANVLFTAAPGDNWAVEAYARFWETLPEEQKNVGIGAGFTDVPRDGTIESVGPGTGFAGAPSITRVPKIRVAALDTVGGGAVRQERNQNDVMGIAARPGCGPDGAFPCFMSAVSLHNDGAVQCSGVLVAPQWVLTAAHCTCDGAPQTASLGNVTPNRYGVAQLEARFVGNARASSTPTASVPISSERYYYGDVPGSPPSFAFCIARAAWKAIPRPFVDELDKARDGSADIPQTVLDWIEARHNTYAQRDLVLVKLRRPLELSGFETVAALADQKVLEANRQLWIAGFGRNDHERDGGHKTVLFGEMIARHCKTAVQQTEFGCVPGVEMIFADPQAETDSCSGDSGAGTYAIAPDGTPQLVAIVSRAATHGACGAGGINVFTTPPSVRAWITTVLMSSQH